MLLVNYSRVHRIPFQVDFQSFQNFSADYIINLWSTCIHTKVSFGARVRDQTDVPETSASATMKRPCLLEGTIFKKITFFAIIYSFY